MSARPSSPAAVSSFIHLDMARGLAAQAVLLGHLRSFVFLSYGDLKTHSPLDIAVWVCTGFGHQAVMIFFVLSGFFITRSIISDDDGSVFSWAIYLIKRLVRLWTVLIPCLIFTLLWDTLGIFLSGTTFYSGQLFQMYNSGPSLDAGGVHLGFSTLLGNLMFLQTILVPIFGSNGPLWSLANEFWYYIMFPLLFVAMRRWDNRFAVVVNLVLFTAICIFVGEYMALSFVIWLAGATSYFIYERRWFDSALRTRRALIISAGLLAISLAASKSSYEIEFVNDFFIGLAAAALVLVLTKYEARSVLYRKIARVLADGSYTMYLVHFPFMGLLASVILVNHKFANSFVGYSVFLGGALITMIYCYAIYWLFERHTGRIRRYCVSRFKQFSKGAIRT